MGIPETVLSNPIVTLGVERFVTAYNQGSYSKSPHALSLSSFKVHPGLVTLPQSRHNPILWSLKSHSPPDGALASACCTVKVVSQCIREGLKVHLGGTLYDKVSSSLPEPSKLSWSDNTWEWSRRADFWRKIVSHQTRADAKGPYWWGTTSRYFYNRHYVVVPVVEEGNIVLSNDMVLMIKDITHSYLAASIHLDLVGSQCDLVEDDLVFLERWSSSVLKTHNNGGYSIIKGIESICKGRLIQMSETILDPDEVYTEMMNKVRIKEAQMGGDGSLTAELGLHLQSITSLDRVSEFFCLLKLAGHPQVDVRGGGSKSREKGQNHQPIRGEDCKGIERSFCHVYTRGYIDSHSQWPPLQFLRREGEDKSQLEVLRDSDFRNLPLGLSMYPASDWDNCVFLPHKSFDFGSDLLSLISDKSLSYLRTEYCNAWKQELDFDVEKPSTQRRVLLELLKMDHFDLEEVVRMVQRREIPDSWKIVTLSPKEREMKEFPRMFAMMVFHMRTFFVALEHNTATHIFSEIGEQTMTLSKLETVRRFFGLSNPGSRTQKAHIEIDFESWNLGWEEKTVSPIGCRQDQIFGEPGTYTYIHEFFKSSLINVRVDGYVPDGITRDNHLNPPESDLLWYNHIGGFEGINQKLWTGDTIGMIHWALWDLGVDYQLSGQADNQVITLTVRFPDEMEDQDKNSYTRKLVALVKRRLRTKCARVGQIIKEEECIQSTSYLSYSKDMWVNGRCLSTSMKSITRLFPTTSDDTPSLVEMVSGVTSGGLSVAEKSLESTSGYWVTLATTSLLLYNELTYSLLHGHKLGDELGFRELPESSKSTLCTALSVIPLELGGLPTASWLEFMHRGVPDPLTSSLAWVNLLKNFWVVSAWGGYLTSNDCVWINKEPNLDMIILDPYSLPLNRPSNPKLKAANAVRDELLDVTRNNDIRVMLHAGDDNRRSSLLEWLSGVTPFFPKVAHELYAASPSGVIEKFSKRFTTTRTLLSIGTMSGVNVQGLSIRADFHYCRWVVNSLKTVVLLPKGKYTIPLWEPNQSYTQAVILRSRWGLGKLDGVTTAHAFDLGIYTDQPIIGTSPPPLIVGAIDSSVTDPIHSRGSIAPYLGSSTQIKTAYKGAKLVDSSTPVKDALKLLSVRNWMSQPGTNMWDSITSLAQSRVNFRVSELEPFIDPVIGGTPEHRFNMSKAESGAYLSCHPNLASNTVLSSNAAGELGEKDYPVMIQSVFLTILSLLAMTWVLSPSGGRVGSYLCYLVPSTNHLPELESAILGDQACRAPDQGQLPLTPFLIGSRLEVPGRSLRSARYNQGGVLPGRVRLTTTPLRDALRHHIRQWVKRIPTPVQYGGRAWAEALPVKMVDLPEVGKISDTVMIDCIVEAFLDQSKMGRLYRESQEDWELRFNSYLEDKILLVAPALLATLNACYKTHHTAGFGRLEGIRGAIRLTSLCLTRWKDLGKKVEVTLFEKEPESLSAVVQVLFCRLIVALNLEGSRRSLTSAKSLGDILRTIRLLAVDDWDLQRRLWIAVDRMDSVSGYISITSDMASRVIRALRGSPDPVPALTDPMEAGEIAMFAKMVTHPCGRCKPSGLALVTPKVSPVMSHQEIIRGWARRPLSHLGSGYYNWGPIRSLTSPNTTYHVIGAGDATIDQVLHPYAKRVYYDTRSSTLRRGQDMVDPPIRGKSEWSTLSPLSWSTNLDITSQTTVSQIALGVRDLDTVVIDVDKVSIRDRIEARDRISRDAPGALVMVRVTGDPEEITNLISSVCSSSVPGGSWWRSPIHPENEVMIGNDTGSPIAPVVSLTQHQDQEGWGGEEIWLHSSASLREEYRYIELSSRLSTQRARLARRNLDRDEEREVIMEKYLGRILS